MNAARSLYVLVAEDEIFLAMATAMALEDRGHRVMTVFDGVEALRAAQSNGPFDVLVTDVNMPRMEGRTLVRELRYLHFSLPVVVVTGYASPETRADFAAIGGSVLVMQKPVDFNRLAVEVERIADAAST